MTGLCVTTTGLPGIRRCTVAGEHGILCPDREINRAIAVHVDGAAPEPSCPGCLPREAEVGHVCRYCYSLLESAYMRWPDWLRLVQAAEGRLVAAEGGGATPDGYSNLPMTTLAVDECTRLLASRRHRTLAAWVENPDGAADAVRFAHAAHAAFRTLQVEVRETRVVREVCPNCSAITPIYGHQADEGRASVRVTCRLCGFELALVGKNPDPLVSDECHVEDHRDCDRTSCQCACHDVGRRSTTAGLDALFDGDQAAGGFVDRAVWVWDGERIRRAADINEGTAA